MRGISVINNAQQVQDGSNTKYGASKAEGEGMGAKHTWDKLYIYGDKCT